jgi:hypothetical protein
MKKNIIISSLLLIYTITFIVLFVKLRSMSGLVLEELAEKNVYYIYAFMFLAGISASLYLIMDSNNKKYILSEAGGAEVVSFENENTEETTIAEESTIGNIQKDVQTIFNLEISTKEKIDRIIWKICDHFELSQALLYIKEEGGQLTLQASYAFILSENDPRSIISGEGLTGQAVMDGKPYFIKDIPEGYMKVISGLGESLPKSLLIIPCLSKMEVKCVFELSSLKEYTKNTFDEIVVICNYVSELLNK